MKPVNAEDKTHMVVGHIVAHLVDKFEEQRQNDPAHPHDPDPITKFHSRKLPKISLLDYMCRIHKYTSCSSSCYLIALIYIDRVVQRNPQFALNRHNAHR